MLKPRFTIQKNSFPNRKASSEREAGFTLMELLVTLAILALFYGLVVANFSVWRGPQFVKSSANELATNINKIRSYSLSARNLDGDPAKMYVLKVSTATPTSYVIQGLAAGASGDVFKGSIEPVAFPGGAYIQDIVLQDKSGNITRPACLQIAFVLPFGRVYLNPACDFNVAKTNSALDALANGKVSIVLARNGTTTTRTVVLDGVSGRVEIQ